VLKELYTQYVHACYAYFGIPTSTRNSNSKNSESDASNETIKVTFISQMVQELLQEAYAHCFKIEAEQVRVTLSSPIMEVRHIQDIKTLWECGIFSEAELKKLFS
jgi:hypothetical protein